MTRHARGERGVATVEFALIVPFLLLLICGVIDFGERYKTAAQYNNAAFVAARSMTIENSAAKAKAAAINAGMPSTLTPVITFTSGYSSCSQAGDGSFGNVTVTITNSSKATATKFFGSTYSVTGKAVARCSGT
ncbi:TadE/TadG family type IV pilus assembly protein [Aeromicrobium panaciterrae]|uniref:TadE/TadG family type IV pilus assembly protein n=1 Tax=Aeromicrobium panaciterrae TaxID=363861 RepID=UPI0031DB6E53